MVTIEKKSGYSASEVEEILASVFGVLPTNRATFSSRLQQLQKLGLPWGTNLGRGVKVRYTLQQIAELLFYLDLLNLGISPAVVQMHFQHHPIYRDSPFWEMVLASGIQQGKGCWAFVRFRMLRYLQFTTEDRKSPTANDRDLSIQLGLNPSITHSERSCVAVNLAGRLSDLCEAAGIDPKTIEVDPWP